MKTITVPEEILNISRLMHTQDNQCTANPMFVVEVKRIVTGFDTDYCDGDERITWVIDDEMLFKGNPEFTKLEVNFGDSGREPENYTRTGFSHHWEFVAVFYTQQAADTYVSRHGHKHGDPLRVSVKSAYRNDEYQAVRDWIMSLTNNDDTKKTITMEPISGQTQ